MLTQSRLRADYSLFLGNYSSTAGECQVNIKKFTINSPFRRKSYFFAKNKKNDIMLVKKEIFVYNGVITVRCISFAVNIADGDAAGIGEFI